MQLYHHDSWLRLDNAEKSAHQSDLTYQVAKQDLITRVTKAYFDLLSTKDDLVFAKAEKDAIARQLEQTKQRFSVGLTAITDVHEAQAQYDSAVTEEIRAENGIYQAEEELRVITNAYPKNVSILNTERFSTSKPTPESADEWQLTAEAKNLDLIAAKVGIDIAKDSINIARAGHYPTLDLGASYGGNDTHNKSTNPILASNDPWLNDYSIGVTLNVPIYSGGAIESSVRQAQNRFVAASQDLSLTHRSVVRTTRNAYNTVIAGVSAIKALEQSVLSAQKALEATEAGFEVGTRTIVDVLDSTRNLYNAKRNLSSTRYGYIQNVLLLKRAAGTITDSDITAINSGLIAAQ
jgi:outer membrane protein